jgi:prevent-host-death family protein
VINCLDRTGQDRFVLVRSGGAVAQSDHWQIQEAKQRFSEVIRAVGRDGPQVITRHGEDVAVIVDMAEYRRLTGPARDVRQVLLGPPRLDDDVIAVLDEIEAERQQDLGRDVDLEAGV